LRQCRFFHRFDGIMEAANAQFAAIKFQASRHSAALGATSAQRESLIGIIVRMHRSTVALSRYTILAPSVQLLLPCVCMRRRVYYHLVRARASI
jgi:hypothetical protein